eukprot:7744192-Ditylum_brightwellii.AAC.1
MCKAILEVVWDCPDLRGSYFFFHKILSQGSYIGLRIGAHITTAPYTYEEGVQQGDVEASFLFCVRTNKANQANYWGLIQTRGRLKASMDDTYLPGQPNTVIPTVSVHKEQLKEVGLNLNETRRACYIGLQHYDNSYRCMLGTMDEGMLQTPEGTPVNGIK